MLTNASTHGPHLRVCALYPDRMNIYADRGNLLLLQKRCEARGIGFTLSASGVGEQVDESAHDFFYIGGGQDREQIEIAQDMIECKREGLQAAADAGKVLLAVCGGYQLLGHSYELEDQMVPGLGLVDLKTVREPGPRLIGNVLIAVKTEQGLRELAGFENHGGRTYLGPNCEALGSVKCGFGNNGSDGLEGVRSRNTFGTYLHGPLLPKNAWFADYLTALALGTDGDLLEMSPLDDALEDRAHAAAVAAARAEAAAPTVFGKLARAWRRS
ncbi:MAG: hypothetical protein JHC87_01375 [Thermoleophilaceae bacterium]|nr:hypothetical protein [Thermoleophilaceae bacterium]